MHLAILPPGTPSRTLRLARAAAIVLVSSTVTACGGSGSTPGPSPLPGRVLPLHEGRYLVTFAGPPSLFAPDGSHNAGCEVTAGVSTVVVASVKLKASGANWVGEADDGAGGAFTLRLGPGPLDGSFPSGVDGIGVLGNASGVAHDTLLGRVSASLGDSRVVLGTAVAPVTLRGGAVRLLVDAGRPLAEGVVDGAVVFRNDRGNSSNCTSGTVRWLLGPAS